jgi:two-component system invasion response regulator UvrY
MLRSLKAMKVKHILLAAQYPIVRWGLKAVISGASDLLCEEATTFGETLELVQSQDWDLIVLGLGMLHEIGLEGFKVIKRIRQESKILVFSDGAEEDWAVRYLKAGAAGYIGKNSGAKEIAAAIQKTLAGGRYISTIVGEMLALDVVSPMPAAPDASLSSREREIMLMLASGYASKDIGDRLFISPKTVCSHRQHLLQKMNFTCNAELTRYALVNRLIR